MVFATRTLLLAALMAGAPLSAQEAQNAERIADGDILGLSAAIDRANASSEPARISLARRGRYDFAALQGQYLSVSGRVEIEGNGATLTNSYEGPLFAVSNTGRLALDGIYVHDITRPSILTRTSSQVALFFNRGSLRVTNSMIESIMFSGATLIAGVVFENQGKAELVLENVSVGEVEATDQRINASDAMIVRNTQEAGVTIRNSTLYAPGLRNPAFLNLDGRFEVSNSILGAGSVLCKDGYRDLAAAGVNIVSDDSCGLDGQLVVPLAEMGVFRFQRFGDAAPVFPISRSSPAVDRGDDRSCTMTDGRGKPRPVDGSGDGQGVCDVGAFEFAGESLEAIRGRFNGLFYNRDADGHFVTLQEVRPDEVVVFWNAFDQRGRQAWILGQGMISGDTLTADGLILEGGTLVPGGAPLEPAVIPWGLIEIEIEGCAGGRFRYDSVLDEFGSGEFELHRLGFVAAIGCQ